MVDSVSVYRFKNARGERMPLNIRRQWNAGTARVSECVLKTLACRGLRVGPSKLGPKLLHYITLFSRVAILTEMMADEFKFLRPEIRNLGITKQRQMQI